MFSSSLLAASQASAHHTTRLVRAWADPATEDAEHGPVHLPGHRPRGSMCGWSSRGLLDSMRSGKTCFGSLGCGTGCAWACGLGRSSKRKHRAGDLNMCSESALQGLIFLAGASWADNDNACGIHRLSMSVSMQTICCHNHARTMKDLKIWS